MAGEQVEAQTNETEKRGTDEIGQQFILDMTYTTAGRYSDLNSISACLAHVFQVQRLMAGFPLSCSFNDQG